MTSHDRDHRKVYAKGFFDGLRVGGEMLTEQKQKAKIESLSAMESKVFESTPIEETWSAQKIGSEIHRKTRSSIDMKTIGSALNRLISTGLATEPRRGEFRRVPVKHETPRATNSTPTLTAEPHRTFETRSESEGVSSPPSDDLGKMAARARLGADALYALADDLDRLALRLQEDADQNAAEASKLRQLKNLLGSIQ